MPPPKTSCHSSDIPISYHVAKLAVTTLPRPSQGSGLVVVETARGGVSKSSLTFTYMEGEPPATPSEPPTQSHSHSRLPMLGGSKKSHQQGNEYSLSRQLAGGKQDLYSS